MNKLDGVFKCDRHIDKQQSLRYFGFIRKIGSSIINETNNYDNFRRIFRCVDEAGV